MGSESLFKKCKKCGNTISRTITTCPDCGTLQISLSFIHWIGIAFLLFIVIGIVNTSEKNKEHASNKTPHISKKDEVRNMLILDFTWSKEGFGAIMEADFTIHNNSLIDIKDIKILCTHYAKSGTSIDSNERKIYEVISANSKKSYLKYNMGFIHEQANKSSCKIINFTLIE